MLTLPRISRIVAAFLLTTGLVVGSGCTGVSAHDRHPGPPPRGTLPMTGDVGDFVPGEVDDPVHDPAIIKHRGTYYVFSTGTLAGPWESMDEIPVPEWTRAYQPNHLWAPDVVRRGDTFYLYYAASSFGENTSAIGVASTRTPGDVESWVDHGPVVTTESGVHDYNAIDPFVFKDRGRWWIAFGSYWSGVNLQRLASMTEVTGEVLPLADRQEPPNAVESPTIFKRGRFYYLMVSWDRCCAGLDSTYRVAVGRSTSVTGPYVDRDGVPLLEGGGTVVLESHANQIGPGGQDVHAEFGLYYLVHHYYDGDADGVIRFQIRSMDWHRGWPSFDLG